jgi:hypothetical protein
MPSIAAMNKAAARAAVERARRDALTPAQREAEDRAEREAQEANRQDAADRFEAQRNSPIAPRLQTLASHPAPSPPTRTFAASKHRDCRQHHRTIR